MTVKPGTEGQRVSVSMLLDQAKDWPMDFHQPLLDVPGGVGWLHLRRTLQQQLKLPNRGGFVDCAACSKEHGVCNGTQATSSSTT